jgi:hypothetical protein
LKKIAAIALVAVLSLSSGCGGNATPNANNTSSASMTGSWAFTMTPTDFPSDVTQAMAALEQTGNSVDGPVTLGGSYSGCGTAGVMSGTATGDALSLQLTQSQSTLTFTGAANAVFASASGTYAATTGQCLQNGGTGTWSATKQ